MLDRFLRVGGTADWITPVYAFFMDLANGPSHTFWMADTSLLSPKTVQRELQRRGVKTWGLMQVQDADPMLTVRAADAPRAYMLMSAWDIMPYPPPKPGRRGKRNGRRKR